MIDRRYLPRTVAQAPLALTLECPIGMTQPPLDVHHTVQLGENSKIVQILNGVFERWDS